MNIYHRWAGGYRALVHDYVEWSERNNLLLNKTREMINFTRRGRIHEQFIPGLDADVVEYGGVTSTTERPTQRLYTRTRCAGSIS